jgi:hypothetical protein
MDYITMLQRMIRSAGARVADSDEVELSAFLGVQATLDEAIASAVRGQHARTNSWAYIALAAGTTRQAAFKRWAKPARVGE